MNETAVASVVFVSVYAGMLLGGIPGLALDRTGVALLGAIALVAATVLSPRQALDAVDVHTLGLLFGLMVVSAQFRLGGFYTAISRAVANAPFAPARLLALQIAVVAALSALLSNDVVCLATTPVVIEGCRRRRLNPIPFLLALACAANIGSAATLIGNPQNMLIGQRLDVSFAGYLAVAALPVLLSLVAAWAIVAFRYRRQWQDESHTQITVESVPFDTWQSTKAIVMLMGLVLIFLFGAIPRDVAALAAAGILLLNRRFQTRRVLHLVDWHLLVLFVGLFVVNHAFETTGALPYLLDGLRTQGIDATQPPWLFAITVFLSNTVSNVPAVMMLLPSAQHPMAASVLALASTFAGNLFIVGSIANIIVVEQAAPLGISLGWKTHARIGVPVTLITLAIAALWLAILSWTGA